MFQAELPKMHLRRNILTVLICPYTFLLTYVSVLTEIYPAYDKLGKVLVKFRISIQRRRRTYNWLKTKTSPIALSNGVATVSGRRVNQ